jgi:hypothetical protein
MFPNSTLSSTHTDIQASHLSNPSTRPFPPSLTSLLFRPILSSFSLVLAFVGVDDVNFNSFKVNRAHHHSRTTRQYSAHVVADKAFPSAARTQAILYLGPNGRRGIGGICLRRPPSRDAVGMGRDSRE